MADFIRTIQPVSVQHPEFPTGFLDKSQSGKIQTLSCTEVGRTWVESYAPINGESQSVIGWLAYINNLYRSMSTFTIQHLLLKTNNGSPSGTARVKGADQTGSSLITDGWTADTNIFLAGDIITIVGSNVVRDITASVTSDGSGNATLPISPPYFSGGSPVDNALITYSSVKFTAIISELKMPRADAAKMFYGLEITFTEVP